MKGSAETLLKQVEQELRAEANRKGAQARFQQFVKLRNEAQFLGTLYTGMDLALNLQAARAAVQQRWPSTASRERPTPGPSSMPTSPMPRKPRSSGIGIKLLLVLAETEAQSAPDRESAEREAYLSRALGDLDHARTFGAASRAFHLRRRAT